MMKSALVICNGEPPSKTLARQLVQVSDLIVAADGGANVARRLGIRPDVIIGDLDSIEPATKHYFSSKLKRPKPLNDSASVAGPRPEGRGYTHLIRISRQDNTDLEKALDFLVAQQVQRVRIIAATGNRLDHTLGNLSIIWNYTKQLDLTFVGDSCLALPAGKLMKVMARVGTTVSLLPFGACSGITLRGLQFPLTNAVMKVGEIGVSNVVVKSPFTVEVKKGRMLMMVLDDHTRIRLLS